jgi:hypothetical protein
MRRVLQVSFALAVVVAVLPPAEAGRSHIMDYAGQPGLQIADPGPDEALIVFMRSPKKLGAVIKVTVYDKRDDGTVEFLAVLTRSTGLVHSVSPGKYTFAVVGESADFIEVNTEGGKIYPVIVKPRTGAWKARFSAFSGCPGSEYWPMLEKWLEISTGLTLKQAEADAWFASHGSSVMDKITKYWPAWLEKGDRPVIQPEHGVASLAGPLEGQR